MRSVMAARSNWYSAAQRLGIRGTEFVSCFDFNILRTKLISSNAFGPLMKWTKSWTNTHIGILEADWWKSFALRQKSIGEKIIRSKVSSALFCEINWNLALPVRFFFFKDLCSDSVSSALRSGCRAWDIRHHFLIGNWAVGFLVTCFRYLHGKINLSSGMRLWNKVSG